VKSFALTLIVLAGTCGMVLADGAVPRFPPRFPPRPIGPGPFVPVPVPVPVPVKPVDPPELVIQVVDDAKDAKTAGRSRPARLQIPQEQIGALRAALDEVDGPTRASLPPVNTIAAGCALALALSFGGLWLVRGRGDSPGKRGLVLAATAFIVLAAGSMTIGADAGKAKKKPDVADTVEIEIIKDKGAPVTLTITKSRMSRSMDDAK
jgi:hypothetical protein